ncbi:kinase-like protein [Rickenella mellea]|uniref:Kinase-like protein n=1 Tax=Rickenella mellea TaxID=50990 RepID=A0A4Y7PKG1_9AGAM|nr:kinase-like protein [Rickenella mellea]
MQLQAFSDAIKDWSRLNHRNIVSFLGYTLTEEGFPSLITPWVCNLSVIEYVKANGEADTVHMVKGVADGLAYLHEQRIIHGDLRSDNVLVSDGKPLLTDFGMSRLLRTMQALRDIRDCMKNIRWMAVELVNPFSNHSTDEMNESGWSDSVTVERTMQTDVWAFGMVAYVRLQ